MTKHNVRCNFCGCAFVPEPKKQREGDIEYTYFNCDFCGKAYVASVTDSELRKNIRKYMAIAKQQKNKPLSKQALRDASALKERNVQRAAELRKAYLAP